MRFTDTLADWGLQTPSNLMFCRGEVLKPENKVGFSKSRSNLFSVIELFLIDLSKWIRSMETGRSLRASNTMQES